jgi:hypothetical protein
MGYVYSRTSGASGVTVGFGPGLGSAARPVGHVTSSFDELVRG